jgi:hypothetical protein
MRADGAEVSWDSGKSKWLSKDATEAQLRSAAEQTVRDDGYEIDPALIAIRH